MAGKSEYMRIREHAIVLAALAITVVLLSAVFGVSYLWRSMVTYHSARLSEQIRDTMYNEISEGNLFGVTAALGRLRMSGLLSEAALVRLNKNEVGWVYVSSDEFRLKLEELGILRGLCRAGEPGIIFDSHERLITVNRLSTNAGEVVCVAGATVVPVQLTRIRAIFLLTLAFIVCTSVAGMALLLVRISRREVELETFASEEKLRLTRALADQAWQVAHDIRSPLAAINLAVSSGSGLDKEKIEVIQGAVSRINDIADDLIAQAKATPQTAMEYGKDQKVTSQFKLEPTRIGDFLTSVWREKKIELSNHGDVEFKLDLDGSAESICNIDKKEFARALSNLINNAVEALEVNRGRVSLAVRDAMGEVAIIVSDNGKGIPQDLLEKLGNDRISVGKSGSSGSGLGLRHARTVAEGMCGRMSIQSRVGRGTLITMTFPVVKDLA